MGKGDIARVWNEYLGDAFARVNDTNARKIVLYLAKHEPEQRSRAEIREDLELTMNDGDLEKRLHQLVKADILAYGSSYFHYRGLGDQIFAMVFRRLYGTEIEHVDTARIEDEFKTQLASARGRAARYRGLAAEYRVRYRLFAAALRGATLADLVTGTAEDIPLGRFAEIRKARFHIDQERSVEVDLHAVSENEEGIDLMIEVKDWQQEVSEDAVRRFIEVKSALEGRLQRPTVFLLYSEGGVREIAAMALAGANIMILDPEKLAAYEAPSGEHW